MTTAYKRELELDLTQVEEEPAEMTQTVPFPVNFAANYMSVPTTPDMTQYGFVCNDGTPISAYTTPPFVSTPTMTPAFMSPQPAFSPMYAFESPLSYTLVSTPPYTINTPTSEQYLQDCNYAQQGHFANYHSRPNHMKVSKKVQVILKRVRSLCAEKKIPVVAYIDGGNVLKISARTASHCEKLISVLQNII